MVAVVYINVSIILANSRLCYASISMLPFMTIKQQMIDCCHMTSGGPIFSTWISCVA